MSLPVFDLTPLTRGAAAERRAVIKGFEVKWQTLMVAAFAMLPALLVVGLLWGALGTAAIFAIPVVVGAALWLFNGRSGKGMKLRNWQSLRNRASSDVGKFYVSGERYDPLSSRTGVIHVRSVHVPAGATKAWE